MNKYTFSFYGKLAGAIGISYMHTVTVEAKTQEEAELKLYETHDHIQQCQCVKSIKVEKGE